MRKSLSVIGTIMVLTLPLVGQRPSQSPEDRTRPYALTFPTDETFPLSNFEIKGAFYLIRFAQANAVKGYRLSRTSEAGVSWRKQIQKRNGVS